MSTGIGTATRPAADLGDPGKGSGPGWKFALLGLLTVFVVLAAYDLTSVSGRLGGGQAPGAAASPRPSPPDGAPPSQAAPPTQAPGPVSHPLKVVSVTAFGPDGPSDGDHPAAATQIGPVQPSAGGSGPKGITAQPWSTSWYATPRFGNLQSGTGLLFDLGHQVTVSSVVLALGTAKGADLQVRVGDRQSLSGLPVAASAAGASADVKVPVKAGPAGRYVLIWFTRLPPDNGGHYRVDVYGVTINGTPSTP